MIPAAGILTAVLNKDNKNSMTGSDRKWMSGLFSISR